MISARKLLELLETPEQNKVYRDALLKEVSNTDNISDKSDLVAKIIPILNYKNLNNFLRYDQFYHLRILSYNYPDTAFSYTLDLNLSSELVKVLASLKEVELHEQLLLLYVSKEETDRQKNCLTIVTKPDFPIRSKLFFMDRFSIPADAEQLLAKVHVKDCNEFDVAYAIDMNILRANVKTITKIINNKSLMNKGEEPWYRLISLYGSFESEELNQKIEKIINDGGNDYFKRKLEIRKVFSKLQSADFTLDLLRETLSTTNSNEEFILDAVNQRNPDIFKSIIDVTLHKQINLKVTKKICDMRLSAFPNSFAATAALIGMYDQGKNIAFSIALLKKIMSKVYCLGMSLDLSNKEANLGNWQNYNSMVKRDIELKSVHGTSMPAVAQKHFFTVEASSGINIYEKALIYKEHGTTKLIRKQLPYRARTQNKKIALFSGDFRYHAMTPFLELISDALCDTDLDITLYSTCPKALNDSKTEEFAKKHELLQVGGFSFSDLEKIRKRNFDLAIDLSQHTQFHGLRFFMQGIASVQATGYWASGFTTGKREFDYLLADEYAYGQVKSNVFVEKLALFRHSAVVAATQNLTLDSKKFSDEKFVGVLSRPIRYNENMLKLLNEVSISSGKRILFSHPSLIAEGTQGYLSEYFQSAGLHRDRFLIDASPLKQVVDKLDFVVDGYKVNSPTVTRDLLMHRIPVLVYEGNDDPFTRLSASFLKSMDLDYLMYDTENKILELINDIEAIKFKLQGHPLDELVSERQREFKLTFNERIKLLGLN